MGNRSSSSSCAFEWEEDREECSLCKVQFHAMFCRRHHCRKCGKNVCAECSKFRKKIPDSQYGDTPVRWCNICAWSDCWLDKSIGKSIMHEALLIQNWEEERYHRERNSTAVIVLVSSPELLSFVISFLSIMDICSFDSSVTNHFIRNTLYTTYKNTAIDVGVLRSLGENRKRWVRLKSFIMNWECTECKCENDGDVWIRECKKCGKERPPEII